jgi:signal transduction histidine kinase/ActR/RegA family two-component response regulator
VLFLPIVALSFLGLSQASRQLESQARTHLAQSVKDASMSLVERLHACELDTEMLLADFASAGSLPGSRVNARLHQRLRKNFRGLGLFLAQGMLEVVGSMPERPQLSPEEVDLVARGLLVLSVRDAGNGPTVIAVRDLLPFGLGDGILVGELELEALLPIEGASNLALAHESTLLLTTDPEVFGPDVIAGLGAEEGDISILQTDAGPHFVAAREVFLRPQFGLVLRLLMGVPEAQVVAPVEYFRTLFLLTALLAFLVVFFLGLKRLQRNLAPIERLQEATRRVTVGDHLGRLEIQTGDEFQALGEAFETMAERVQQRTRELEAANSAKSRFLANMSHEVRTPLSSILGYADLCLAEPGVRGALRESLGVIRSSGTHLLRVINDVLDVACIEAGKVQVERRPCAPLEVLAEAARMVEPQVKARELTFEHHVREGVPAQVVTDPDRLRQILVNLFSNAAKFTERGGITVTVEPRLADGRASLCFEVTDTGPGIQPEQVQRLFQPFTQLDDSMSRRHGGVGLGLSIARSLARSLGGDLTCRSTVGQGSTFSVTIEAGEPAAPLPSAPPAEVAPSSAAPAQASESSDDSARLLVVEDVEVNRRLLVVQLRSAGFVVEEAENGRVAVDKVHAAWSSGRPFALVFMDMQMPVLDGYEATRILRRNGYDGAIVALTAHASSAEREHILAVGCDAVAPKPIERARLHELTRAHQRLPRRSAS